MKKTIAITGGIGSGKSTLTEYLKSLGYPTFSSDTIVSELYETRKVKRLVKKLFPTAVKGLFNLTLDRKVIAEQVFNDKNKLLALTDLITPLVLEEIKARTAKTEGVCFVEVPLLFECSYQTFFDGVWVVTRPLEDRITGVMARSNLTREQVVARINNQVDYDALDLSPYVVISNDGNAESLYKKVKNLIDNI